MQALSRCWRKLNGRLTIAPGRADPPLSSLQAMEDALKARSLLEASFSCLEVMTRPVHQIVFGVILAGITFPGINHCG